MLSAPLSNIFPSIFIFFFFFQAEVGTRDRNVTGVQTCALPISSVTFFLALLLIFKLAPNEKVSFRQAITGALFATIFWQLTSIAFSFYVNTLGNYSATYGKIGRASCREGV